METSNREISNRQTTSFSSANRSTDDTRFKHAELQRFVIRYFANRINRACTLGLLTTFAVWLVPQNYKLYHLKRDFDDFKILFIERDSEWGFAQNGLVKIHTSTAFSGTRKMLEPVRQDFIHRLSRSKTHVPDDSWRPHFDEWGPNRLVIETPNQPLTGFLAGMPTPPIGTEITYLGHVYCVPYSCLAIVFATPLLSSFFKRPS